MSYVCPVCYFDKLEEAPLPNSYEICPSCGTEFGYDDINTTFTELRMNWITSGMHWWSNDVEPPKDWDPIQQLSRITNRNLNLVTEKRSVVHLQVTNCDLSPISNNITQAIREASDRVCGEITNETSSNLAFATCS